MDSMKRNETKRGLTFFCQNETLRFFTFFLHVGTWNVTLLKKVERTSLKEGVEGSKGSSEAVERALSLNQAAPLKL